MSIMGDIDIRIMHLLPQGTIGGMENGVINIVNNLTGNKLVFSICILSDYDEQVRGLVRPEVPVITVPKKKVGFDSTLSFRLARVFKRENVDVIHTHNWGTYSHGVFAARLASVPVVIHGEHGFNFDELRGEGLRKRFLKKILAKFVDKIITMTDDLGAYLCNDLSISPGKVRTIYNGVDREKFFDRRDKDAIKRALGLEDRTVVGSVGRLDKIKNYELLLRSLKDVMEELADVTCLLVGDGPERENLERLSEELGISRDVTFLGYRKDTARLLNALDIFVLPSFMEGLSNTVLEAMSCGVPTVVSDVGGNREIITDGINGCLFESNSRAKLTRAITSLLRDEDKLDRIRKNALETVSKRYDMGRMLRTYEELYLSFFQVDPSHEADPSGRAGSAG